VEFPVIPATGKNDDGNEMKTGPDLTVVSIGSLKTTAS
jgi:hypothetical protein